ncbi:MAG: metallophosphoesterase family protein [Desulforhopalus sp.]
MKIALLSDIHANLEALEAVSADIDRRHVDRVICLGDNIGYGPDPEKVIQHIRRRGYVAILGNHEFALTDKRARRWLNFQAAENNEATEALLSVTSKIYCRSLPPFIAWQNGYFVHGYPPKSVFLYLERQSDERVVALFDKCDAALYFVGHSHLLQLVTRTAESVVRKRLSRGKVELVSGQKYIINCGSVGQPRDGDHTAKYLLWDVGCGSIDVIFVDYDREVTKAKIRARGFPEAYVLRLG